MRKLMLITLTLATVMGSQRSLAQSDTQGADDDSADYYPAEKTVYKGECYSERQVEALDKFRIDCMKTNAELYETKIALRECGEGPSKTDSSFLVIGGVLAATGGFILASKEPSPLFLSLGGAILGSGITIFVYNF